MTLNLIAQEEFIKDWLVIGPFQGNNTESLLKKSYIKDETGIIPSQGAKYADKMWHHETADQYGKLDFVDLNYSGEYCAVYSHVYFYSPKEKNIYFHLGSDDGIAVWLNGKQIFCKQVFRGWKADDDQVLARLGKGWNRLLIKVVNGTGGHALSARITDSKGNPIQSLLYKINNPFGNSTFINPEVSPWLVCRDVFFDDSFSKGKDVYLLGLNVDIKNLGLKEAEDAVCTVTVADDKKENVYVQSVKIKKTERPQRIILEVDEILSFIKRGKQLCIESTWEKQQQTSRFDFYAEEILKILLNSSFDQTSENIVKERDYLRKNLEWARFFEQEELVIPRDVIYNVISSYFNDDWDEVKSYFEKINYKIRMIAAELKENTIYFTGNAHIDMAWLWKFEETVQVCYETFASALNFAEKYPNFVYCQSSAQAYWWMENRFLDYFKAIQDKVKSGQWEIIGGMWVEPDLNIPNGESIVRQLLYGKRYFRKKFGIDVKVGFNPDTFGYCWTLPQIFKKAGINSFVTQKITWNDTNEFPHKIFWWESPDGSRILAVFPFTYVHTGEPKRVAREFIKHKQVSGTSDQLVLYGVGNHGGGPTQENIDNIHQIQKIDAYPRAEMSSVKNFVDIVRKKYDDLPVWDDELYLEYHRGTYTSQAQTKKNNRLSEIRMEGAEKLAVISGLEYPGDELFEGWHLTLFNQFHDILPGSSISEVYDDADVQYENIRKLTGRVINWSLEKLLNSVDYQNTGIPVIVFNPLNWKRKDVVAVEIPENYTQDMGIYDGNEHEIPYQILEGKLQFSGVEIPACGFKTFYLKRGRNKKMTDRLSISETSLENSFLNIEINPKNGNISRIFDKKNKREILESGKEGNVLEAFKDIPEDWDAWNIAYPFEKKCNIDNVQDISILYDTPQKVALRIIRTYSKSKFIQDLVLYNGIPRLDIENRVDWHEDHVLLKSAFHLNVFNDFATYEIPFGIINRPTVAKTSFDSAKFEVSGHKWIDMTENDSTYGVSLLNDCKYGFDVKKNRMRITLLKSAKYPDPEADMGKHYFTYSIYPHEGSWKTGNTYQAAYELNYPLLTKTGDLDHIQKSTKSLPEDLAFITSDQQNIIISAIKKAEDSDDVIVRFYETYGRKIPLCLTFSSNVIKAEETNLLEEPAADVRVEGREIILDVDPYEIKTLKIRLTK